MKSEEIKIRANELEIADNPRFTALKTGLPKVRKSLSTEYGMLYPILVRELEDRKLRIIDGELRARASEKDLVDVKAYKGLTDVEEWKIRILAHQREEWTGAEKGQALLKYMDFLMTRDKISVADRRKRSVIREYALRISEESWCPYNYQAIMRYTEQALAVGKLSMKTLLNVRKAILENLVLYSSVLEGVKIKDESLANQFINEVIKRGAELKTPLKKAIVRLAKNLVNDGMLIADALEEAEKIDKISMHLDIEMFPRDLNEKLKQIANETKTTYREVIIEALKKFVEHNL